MENQDKDGLMTVEQFNNAVEQWKDYVVKQAKDTLKNQTHGTGRLRRVTRGYADKLDDKSPIYKVAFRFRLYGVYLTYGVGRGYINLNGRLVRGSRETRSPMSILERYESGVEDLKSLGYDRKQIYQMMYNLTGADVKRHPLDWIDYHMEKGRTVLADKVAEYYGDRALRQMLEMFDRVKIKKVFD